MFFTRDDWFATATRPHLRGLGCKVWGTPCLSQYMDGCTIMDTLPTMQAALIQYDPFIRPRAAGWQRERDPWQDTFREGAAHAQ